VIRYLERNPDDIIQCVQVEIDNQEKQHLEQTILSGKYKGEYEGIARCEDNKLIYKTEVLVPKVRRPNRVDLLLLLGNPATHSVQSGMFFAYEIRKGRQGVPTWTEHRFWRALRHTDCEVLRFRYELPNPKKSNIDRINAYKRKHLLDSDYKSRFNISILPYFSFPTPSSAGVNAIRSIVGGTIFARMRKEEFRRFKDTVIPNDLKDIICFNKTVAEEISGNANGEKRSSRGQLVYELHDDLKGVRMYYAGPTRRMHTEEGKRTLAAITSAILSQREG